MPEKQHATPNPNLKKTGRSNRAVVQHCCSYKRKYWKDTRLAKLEPVVAVLLNDPDIAKEQHRAQSSLFVFNCFQFESNYSHLRGYFTHGKHLKTMEFRFMIVPSGY